MRNAGMLAFVVPSFAQWRLASGRSVLSVRPLKLGGRHCMLRTSRRRTRLPIAQRSADSDAVASSETFDSDIDEDDSDSDSDSSSTNQVGNTTETLFCEACGREDGPASGCDGTGRIAGGLGAVVDWWPIKAYRPCPELSRANKQYRRSGQSLDEIAFGRVDNSTTDRPRGR